MHQRADGGGRGAAAGLREERKPKRLERVSTSRSLLPRLERSGARAGNSYGGRGASGGGGGEGGRGVLESRASGRQGICSSAANLNNRN